MCEDRKPKYRLLGQITGWSSDTNRLRERPR